MDEKELQEEPRVDLYALPVVGGAIAGYIIAEWLGISGILGAVIGAFVVDAFRGLRGTHRFVKETEGLVGQARSMWEKQKGRSSTRGAPPDINGPSQPPPGAEPDGGEVYPSA